VESSNSLSGLASIIIPGCKPLELIRPCITALRRYTRRPWELIVIDDGSSDEMSTYLESVRDAVSVPVTVITNVTSRGIAAAINQGLKAARGEYLVLLNNDVVVTDGWLGQLIALANAKGDFTAESAECAETKTEGGREGRPAVDLGAGSGDASSRVGASWDQGAGFFDKLNGIGKHAANKILFASVHSILDFSNGASVATMDVLQGLTARGFECQAFCTAKLDLQTEVSFEKMIGDLHEPFEVRPSVCGTDQAPILYTRRGRVPITFIRQSSTRHVTQSREEVQTVLRFFAKFLDVFRPDVLFTYGGDPITQGMIAVARHRRIPVVFAIHNFGYTDIRHFSNVDYCFVPSEFARAHYRDKLGLDCRVLPNPVDWERVRVDDREPRYLTFVNPALYKGAYPFVRIAQELGRRRPDIPLLVVESRATKQTLGECGLRPSDHPNIQIMPVTTDPRWFWRLTKILLMPSLWWESQGLVAVEAMINGIPVVASDRGALPETLGDGGIALSLPDRLTPTSQILPTAEEVEPWVGAIIRLWDDPAWYREQSNRGKNEAERWHPDRLRPLYAEFFGAVCGRSGDAMARRRLNHANAEGGIRLTTKGTK
jgi:glycosyltransferase involved in cell wall biosynthesis